MTCQYREPEPDTTPCYCTATFGADMRRGGYIEVLKVCDHHALTLREQGVNVWPISSQSPA